MSSGAQGVSGQAYGLLHLYTKCYEKRYGKKPLVNRYRERWGFQDMLDSLGERDAKEVIEYYFETSASSHTIKYLFNNFDVLKRNLDARTADRERRKLLMQQTKERLAGSDS